MLLTNIELFAGQQATLHDDDVLSTVVRLVLHGRSKSRFSISIERTIIVQSAVQPRRNSLAQSQSAGQSVKSTEGRGRGGGVDEPLKDVTERLENFSFLLVKHQLSLNGNSSRLEGDKKRTRLSPGGVSAAAGDNDKMIMAASSLGIRALI